MKDQENVKVNIAIGMLVLGIVGLPLGYFHHRENIKREDNQLRVLQNEKKQEKIEQHQQALIEKERAQPQLDYVSVRY